MSHFRISVLLLIFCAALVAQPAHAQQDPELEVGMKPFGSYNGGNIDTVALFHGQLSLDIPLISYPQRGGKLKLDYHLRYANVGVQADYIKITIPPPGQGSITYYQAAPPSGWCGNAGSTAGLLCHGFRVVDEQSVGNYTSTFSYSTIPNTAYNAYSPMVMMPDGGAHALFPTCGTCSPNVWESVDGTSFRLQCYVSYGCPVSGTASYNVPGTTIIDSTGTSYVFPTSGQAYRQDSNGNTITYSGTGAGLTDTMGRVIPSIPAPTSNVTGCPQPPSVPLAPSTASTWNPPGVNGGSYPILFCYIQLSETNPIAFQWMGGPWVPATYTGTELQSVVLPNGTSWTFEYTTDGNADLSEVIFPTGGTLSYGSWQNVAGSGVPGFYVDYNRALGTRTLNPNDGVTPSSTWAYSYSSNPSGTTTVSSPPSSGTIPDDTVHTFSAGYEIETQYYQGSHSTGVLLKTVNTQFSSQTIPWGGFNYLSAINIVPIQTATVWPNGQQNKTTYAYDSGVQIYQPTWFSPGYVFSGPAIGYAIYGKVLTKGEYDYGSGAPGPLLRTTTNTYLALNNSTYLSYNLLDLPSSVQMKDSGGTQRAYTAYGYDGSALASSGVTTQHVTPPNGSYRGNLTSVSRWLNTNGTYLTSTSTFYDTGTVSVAKDPKLNPTTYLYSSTYVGAFPTTVTNALNQSATSVYDFNTGLATSTTDPNNQQTQYHYDSLLRTTEIDPPDGGQTTFTYPTPNEVDISEKMDTRYKTASLLVDGVGRKIRQIVSNGEAIPYDQADTCYDGNGRIDFKSDPYQGNGFSTGRACAGSGDSFVYEALGRTASVTHSDGSSVLSSYTGRATSVQDEGNGTQRVQRVSQVDGLGRLKSLCEITSTTLTVGITGSTTPAACSLDIAGTGFLTTYAYDTLDNLTSVAQGPLTARSFVYDSLSRLTSATNPEAGATTYTYDANGNVLTKTDARSKVITYAYDALNRVTGKIYSDTTPAVTYSYDQTSARGVNLTNAIGRRSSESTAGANATASVFSYDPMGRVLNNSQCTPQNCATTVFPISYAYDLLGNLTSATNGTGVTLSNAFNLGARPTSLTSTLSDANHPGTLFSSVHYNAFGSLLSGTLGAATVEWVNYTSRGWPTSSGVGGTFSIIPATPGSGSATISGTEQSVMGTPGTGTVTISGAEQPPVYGGDPCAPYGYSCPIYIYDTGTVQVTVNGVACSMTYGQNDTPSTIAAALASACTNSTVTAIASGSVLTLTAKPAMTTSNYPLSMSVTWLSSVFSSPSFTATPSGATLTGSTAGAYDSGSVWVNVNGFQVTASYGQSSTSTTIASALASALNTGSSPVTASISGSVLTVTAKQSGSITNYPFSTGSSTSLPGTFANPSFSAPHWDATLIGGTDQTIGSNTLYAYSLLYAPNGDVLAANDSVNGNWTYAYDAFNRLTSANATGQAYTYAYDRFGNRWQQNGPHSSQLGFDANNRIASGSGVAYDAAGDTANDGSTAYTYDAEGRIITAVNGSSGTSTYVYDAEGRRVRKTTVAGGTVDFLYDLGGREIAQISSAGAWTRGEVYAGGRHLATYSGGTGGTTYFIHADWLGTERARSTVAGASYETCTSLPFGDWLTCSGGDPSPMHLTGKEHDSETNLENFGARYDSSSLGRFMTPDWSGKPQGVPYATFNSPQSLNLYSYVQNNPVTSRDLDGHWCAFGYGTTCPEVGPPPPPPPPPPAPFFKPNPSFKTKDEAGKAAAKAINPTAQKEKAEYGGRVYKDGNEYSYTGPFTKGKVDEVNPDAGVTGSGKDPKTLKDIRPLVPPGTTSAGEYHDHPAAPGYASDRLSPSDIGRATYQNTTSYVGTPSGDILKFDGETREYIDMGP